MVLTRVLSGQATHDLLQRRCLSVREALVRDGLYEPARESPGDRSDAGRALATRWRIAPQPFLLTQQDLGFFQSLGTHLLAFYRALNRLYFESVRGMQPAWVHAYLDQGKPESLITYARMKRFREALPGVIRPDIIPTENGHVITELDSVPGGIGLTASLARAYSELAGTRCHLDATGVAAGQPAQGNTPSSTPCHQLSAISHQLPEIIGGRDGNIHGFAAMLRATLATHPEVPAGCLAIVVSEEARDYRAEMTWLAARLCDVGLEAYCVEPQDVRFTEEGLLLDQAQRHRRVAAVYRFFELFDLKNVPKAELIMYSAKQERVVVTPPFKPALEEKLAFALYHHPILRPFWQRELGATTDAVLMGLLPRTWILDPRPLPPAAVIPDLRLGDRAIADWKDLSAATQKGRRFVVKPSGFSELAWGSRGVSVGHDLPQTEWATVLERALESFPSTPYVLQEFHKGRQFELSYYDDASEEVVPMAGRARLSPYYFVTGERAELAAILATVCPPDKKLIHGMRDAVLAPCAVATSAE
jgi:hypothetical protein